MAQVSPAWSLVVVAISLAGCYPAPSMDAADAGGHTVWPPTELAASSVEGCAAADEPEVVDLVAAEVLVSAQKPLSSEADDVTTQAESVPIEQTESTNAAGGVPKVVLPDDTFDFGTMDPFQTRQHTFVIRNEGDAPLLVEEGQTSCKCTLGKLAESMIPPGEETTVMLQWKSASGNRLFAHQAEILTNDPVNPVVIVRVKGHIVSTLFADPEAFALPGIYPGTEASSSVVIASHRWSGFDIRDVKTSLVDLRWEIVPLSAEDAKEMNVKSGHRVTITLPVDLPRGYFNHWLRMMIHPRDHTPRLCEIPIRGSVLRRISIYGDGIDSSGLIRLGQVSQGRELKQYFTVKVRDPDPELVIASVETDPAFLVVTFAPLKKSSKPGLYRMCVEVPASAPTADFVSETGGVHVKFKNPRFDDLHLKVQFAVLGDDGC